MLYCISTLLLLFATLSLSFENLGYETQEACKGFICPAPQVCKTIDDEPKCFHDQKGSLMIQENEPPVAVEPIVTAQRAILLESHTHHKSPSNPNLHENVPQGEGVSRPTHPSSYYNTHNNQNGQPDLDVSKPNYIPENLEMRPTIPSVKHTSNYDPANPNNIPQIVVIDPSGIRYTTASSNPQYKPQKPEDVSFDSHYNARNYNHGQQINEPSNLMQSTPKSGVRNRHQEHGTQYQLPEGQDLFAPGFRARIINNTSIQPSSEHHKDIHQVTQVPGVHHSFYTTPGYKNQSPKVLAEDISHSRVTTPSYGSDRHSQTGPDERHQHAQHTKNNNPTHPHNTTSSYDYGHPQSGHDLSHLNQSVSDYTHHGPQSPLSKSLSHPHTNIPNNYQEHQSGNDATHPSHFGYGPPHPQAPHNKNQSQSITNDQEHHQAWNTIPHTNTPQHPLTPQNKDQSQPHKTTQNQSGHNTPHSNHDPTGHGARYPQVPQNEGQYDHANHHSHKNIPQTNKDTAGYINQYGQLPQNMNQSGPNNPSATYHHDHQPKSVTPHAIQGITGHEFKHAQAPLNSDIPHPTTSNHGHPQSGDTSLRPKEPQYSQYPQKTTSAHGLGHHQSEYIIPHSNQDISGYGHQQPHSPQNKDQTHLHNITSAYGQNQHQSGYNNPNSNQAPQNKYPWVPQNTSPTYDYEHQQPGHSAPYSNQTQTQDRNHPHVHNTTLAYPNIHPQSGQNAFPQSTGSYSPHNKDLSSSDRTTPKYGQAHPQFVHNAPGSSNSTPDFKLQYPQAPRNTAPYHHSQSETDKASGYGSQPHQNPNKDQLRQQLGYDDYQTDEKPENLKTSHNFPYQTTPGHGYTNPQTAPGKDVSNARHTTPGYNYQWTQTPHGHDLSQSRHTTPAYGHEHSNISPGHDTSHSRHTTAGYGSQHLHESNSPNTPGYPHQSPQSPHDHSRHTTIGYGPAHVQTTPGHDLPHLRHTTSDYNPHHDSKSHHPTPNFNYINPHEPYSSTPHYTHHTPEKAHSYDHEDSKLRHTTPGYNPQHPQAAHGHDLPLPYHTTPSYGHTNPTSHSRNTTPGYGPQHPQTPRGYDTLHPQKEPHDYHTMNIHDPSKPHQGHHVPDILNVRHTTSSSGPRHDTSIDGDMHINRQHVSHLNNMPYYYAKSTPQPRHQQGYGAPQIALYPTLHPSSRYNNRPIDFTTPQPYHRGYSAQEIYRGGHHQYYPAYPNSQNYGNVYPIKHGGYGGYHTTPAYHRRTQQYLTVPH